MGNKDEKCTTKCKTASLIVLFELLVIEQTQNIAFRCSHSDIRIMELGDVYNAQLQELLIFIHAEDTSED